MKCLYCNGDMKKSDSTYTINRKGYHLFLQHIPVYICSKCGEKYFGQEEIGAIQNLMRTLESEVSKLQAVG